MNDLLAGQLVGLDEDALTGIIDASSAQAEYLGRFADRESRAMAGVCSIVLTAAETALLARQTGITLLPIDSPSGSSCAFHARAQGPSAGRVEGGGTLSRNPAGRSS
jgi:hypothetical protein